MRTKTFRLYNSSDSEGYTFFIVSITRKGKISFYSGYLSRVTLKKYDAKGKVKYREKKRIRSLDKGWVKNNIPSSIWWHTQIHHDWKNGGVMFLLDPLKHSEITRKEGRR